MPDPIIVLENLRKAYGSTIAANDITLSIPRGEIFGFLGANGAGKTSIFDAIFWCFYGCSIHGG